MHETLPINTSILIYINKVNNGLVLKIKDAYKLELQAPENIKLFGSKEDTNRQNKECKKCTKS